MCHLAQVLHSALDRVIIVLSQRQPCAGMQQT